MHTTGGDSASANETSTDCVALDRFLRKKFVGIELGREGEHFTGFLWKFDSKRAAGEATWGQHAQNHQGPSTSAVKRSSDPKIYAKSSVQERARQVDDSSSFDQRRSNLSTLYFDATISQRQLHFVACIVCSQLYSFHFPRNNASFHSNFCCGPLFR